MEKINIPQAESKSADLIQENLEQLKQIFPEVMKEGKVDFEALHDLLGNYADTPEERFALNWAGKANARREAQKRSTGTLRPCPEESLDWDTTENLYIEGDNLEVLKLLQKSYHSRVKMIYIDPPYNTGKDFVYKDNYTDNMQNYLELTGQDKKLSTNTESDGRYHSNWLNMMYPRLKLARNLLKDDGVIFISIDDNEVVNLRKICEEIFGEENFVADICVVNNLKGRNDKKYIARANERLLMFVKSGEFEEYGLSLNDIVVAEYKEMDDKGKYRLLELRKRGGADTRQERPNMYYPFFVNPLTGSVSLEKNTSHCIEAVPVKSDGVDGRWRWGIDTARGRLEFLYGKKVQTADKYNIYEKDYLEDENGTRRIRPKSVMSGAAYSTDVATKEYRAIMSPIDFSSPKPVAMLSDLIEYSAEPNSGAIFLDFFSGSATTAHAVMQLNAEDGGNRKYICVQIPEPTPEDSEARKAGYATIPEIAKERIRRAGKKIVEEQKKKSKEGGLFAEEPAKLDIGFKVFKLDSSNINAWDSNPDNLETALNNSLFNIKTDRSEDDLLYEILIKYGIELTETINRHTIDGKTVYEMGAGSLIVCLADNLSSAVAEGIGKLYEEVRPEGLEGNCRVVFKDSGFNGSDEVKTNTMLILKQHGILNVASV